VQNSCRRLALLIFICSAISLLLFPEKGFPVNFTVSPVRVFFDSTNKTNILTIKNESNEDVTLQLNAYAWTQDKEAKDVYSPTKDIIFFPRIVTVKKEEEKIIRLGTKIPREEQEKTYRLFIEEIPTPAPVETTAVRLIMKVGVPVFITPVKAEAGGSVEKIELLKSKLYIKLKNNGNVHFIIRSINVKGNDTSGKEAFKTEIAGGYLHNGNSKGFTIEIPEKDCLKITNLKIDINTDRLSMAEKLDVSQEMCAP
jgi:fimbrial chaperone protein